MKRLIAIFAALVLSVSFALAGNVRAARSITGFTQIENYTPYDIHYYEGSDYRVNVVGPQSDLPYITTDLRQGVLVINTVSTHRFTGKPYIEVYCPKNRLTNYYGRGAGNFKALTAVNLANAIFNLSGSGNVVLGTVIAATLDLITTGKGNITVSDGRVSGAHNIQQGGSGRVTFNGKSQQTNIVNSGSGQVRFNGQNQQTTVKNSGTGKNTGKVQTTSFDGRNTGSGVINMRGQAQTVTTQQQGSGKSEFKRK